MIVYGERWERLRDVPALLGGRRSAGTLRAWVSAGVVRAHRTDDGVWVALDDVLARDAACGRRRRPVRRV